MKLVLIAVAAGVLSGCTFISPNFWDKPEARFDLSEPFEYTRHDRPPEEAASLVETARWDQAVAVSLVMTEFAFAPGELRFRAGVPYALKIGNQGVWPHAFGATHFFRAIAVRNIEAAPFDGPGDTDGRAIAFVPDAYGPSAVYVPAATTEAPRGAVAGAGGEAQIPEPPFTIIEIEPNQAVIVYFVPVRAGTYYLRSVRSDDLLRGMRGRIVIE